MAIGEKIRKARKEKGLTQEAIASVLGVSRQAIAKWESGQSAPSTENLIKLAGLFGLPLGELADLKGSQTPALEEFARRKMDEARKREERRALAAQSARAIVRTWAVCAGIYLGCYFAFHLAGVRDHIWHWLESRHVLPLTALFSTFLTLSGQRRVAVAVLIGTALSIILGNVCGGFSAGRSIIGYETGWIFYLIGVGTAMLAGCFAEYRALAAKEHAPRRSRNVRFATWALCVLFSVIVGFTAAGALKCKTAAERGYRRGYAAGALAVQNGQSRDPRFLEVHYPAEYPFGSRAFKGYALYWLEGYEAGFDDTAGSR